MNEGLRVDVTRMPTECRRKQKSLKGTFLSTECNRVKVSLLILRSQIHTIRKQTTIQLERYPYKIIGRLGELPKTRAEINTSADHVIK